MLNSVPSSEKAEAKRKASSYGGQLEFADGAGHGLDVQSMVLRIRDILLIFEFAQKDAKKRDRNIQNREYVRWKRLSMGTVLACIEKASLAGSLRPGKDKTGGFYEEATRKPRGSHRNSLLVIFVSQTCRLEAPYSKPFPQFLLLWGCIVGNLISGPDAQ